MFFLGNSFLNRVNKKKEENNNKEVISDYDYDNGFRDIQDVDKVFCNLRLFQRNLAKYFLEELYDADLDCTQELDNIVNNLGKNPRGGIHWINYAFSDKYQEEDEPKESRSKDSDMYGKKYVEMSLYEVLEKYAKANIGEFIVPQEFKTYVKTSWENEEISSECMPTDPQLFEGAKAVVEELINKYEMPTQSAIALIGAMWTECGWQFEKSVANQQELNNGGLPGTGGYANCGECWCQITFWEAKLSFIKLINAPVPRDKSTYNLSTSTHLSDLDWDWQVKMVYEWIKKQKLWGEILLDPNGDPGEQIVASYIQKAGFGKEPTLAEADRTAKIYMKSHKEVNKVPHPTNGFSKQVFVAMKFSGYIANIAKGMSGDAAVPSDEEIFASL